MPNVAQLYLNLNLKPWLRDSSVNPERQPAANKIVAGSDFIASPHVVHIIGYHTSTHTHTTMSPGDLNPSSEPIGPGHVGWGGYNIEIYASRSELELFQIRIYVDCQ